MNFLAHLALTPLGNKEALVGNFIGDAIKGNSHMDLPKNVALGVKMHRKIDEFTDNHELTKQNLKLFYPEIGKYSGIALDILYDHLLCNYWEQFYSKDLDCFIEQALHILDEQEALIPLKMRRFLTLNKEFKWVHNYKNWDGIKLVLKQFNEHRAPKSNLIQAPQIFLANQKEIERNFVVFYKDLVQFCKEYYY